MTIRADQRQPDQLRPVSFQRGYTRYAEGSVLVSFGDTVVLCNATVEEGVPPFMRGEGRGWVTAEYAMLPRSRPRVAMPAKRLAAKSGGAPMKFSGSSVGRYVR